jgi:MFS transporter, DHA1 family, staphyloferrin A biosynthesis exporter
LDEDHPPASGFRNISAVLRHRNYRLLWTGTLVSNSGDWMDQVALNWLVLETTGSAFYLGLVNLFRAVPILALTLIGGVAADRFERRRLMMVSQAFGMVLAITLAVLVALGQTQIWIILAIAAGRGAMVAFNQPARHSLVSEVVPRHILPSAIALSSLTFNLTKIIGPLLAGIIIATWGTAACFAANALSFVAVLWTLALMQFPPRAARERGESVLQSLLVGFAYLGTNRLVLLLVLVAFIPVFFGGPYLQLLALFAVEVFKAGPDVVGLLTASAALGAMCGALILATVPAASRSGMVMLLVMLAYGAVICAFAVTGSLFWAGALLMLVGAGQIACNAINNILLQTIVPDEVRGRVLSVLLLNKGLVQLGTFTVATLAAFIGVRWAMLLSGSVVVVSAAALLILTPALRRLRT